ncbi:hypothetical protein IID22_02280 [Patescibacteria group bacterium]|nr:hypothetical protein [Patescibacteria group bacterium]
MKKWLAVKNSDGTYIKAGFVRGIKLSPGQTLEKYDDPQKHIEESIMANRKKDPLIQAVLDINVDMESDPNIRVILNLLQAKYS